jgi:hypothetical protein
MDESFVKSILRLANLPYPLACEVREKICPGLILYEEAKRGRDFRDNITKGDLLEAAVESALRLLGMHIVLRDNRQSIMPDFGCILFRKHQRSKLLLIEAHNFNNYPVSEGLTERKTVRKFHRIKNAVKIVVTSANYTKPAIDLLEKNEIFLIKIPRQVLGRQDYYSAIVWIAASLELPVYFSITWPNTSSITPYITTTNNTKHSDYELTVSFCQNIGKGTPFDPGGR